LTQLGVLCPQMAQSKSKVFTSLLLGNPTIGAVMLYSVGGLLHVV